MSRPAWARGLKHQRDNVAIQGQNVAPCVGAWIETHIEGIATQRYESRPAWARGLKPVALTEDMVTVARRALRGRVD